MNTASSTATPIERRSLQRISRALIISAAGLSFLFSVYLWFLVEREQGLWVPSILSLGGLITPAPSAGGQS